MVVWLGCIGSVLAVDPIGSIGITTAKKKAPLKTEPPHLS